MGEDSEEVSDFKSYLIKEILAPDSYNSIDADNEKVKKIQDISKINLFIGENNSGKSRLLRQLFASDFTFIPQYNLESISVLYSEFYDLLNKRSYSRSIKLNDLREKYNAIKTVAYEIDKENSLAKIIDPFLKYHTTLTEEQLIGKNKKRGPEIDWFDEKYNKILSKFYQNFGEINSLKEAKKILEYPKFTKIYIPISRGLKPFLSSKDINYDYSDHYKERVISEYFKDSKKNFRDNPYLVIFTGLSIYQTVKDHLLGNLQERELIRKYEEYLKDNFFEGKEITLIPSEKTHQYLTIKIGNEKERPVFELGDGIQAIMMITLPLFLHKNENVLLFVDEPEQYMHPGLQRKLIDTLLNQEGFGKFQYFITTHSNHFLDLTLDFNDISIYSLKKELPDGESKQKDPEFFIENLSSGDRSALECLGVQNSSVFITNCTIWVEGVTDRRYIRKYLEVYINYKKDSSEFKKFKEDYHYSFVEYAGNNITHWSFLEKEDCPIEVQNLCGRFFLIADSDDTDSEIIEDIVSGKEPENNPTAKDERIAHFKDNWSGQFYQIPAREIENILSPKVIMGIMEDYKEKNIPDFKEADYKNEKLGKYIDKLIGDNKQRKGSYAEGNTVSSKLEFCKKAINHIENWDDLTNDAQELTVKIYEFIQKQNP